MKVEDINFDNESKGRFRLSEVDIEQYASEIENLKDNPLSYSIYNDQDVYIKVFKSDKGRVVRAKLEQDTSVHRDIINRIIHNPNGTLIRANNVLRFKHDVPYYSIDISIFHFGDIRQFLATDELIISIPPTFISILKKNNVNKIAKKFFEEEFLLNGDNTKYLFLQENSEGKAARIIGSNFICVIEQNPDIQTIEAVDLIRRKKNSEIRGNIALCKGNIEFVDGIKKIKQQATQIFNSNMADNSYFEKIWLCYNRAMIEAAKDEVDRIGVVEYDGYNKNRFIIKNKWLSKDFFTSSLGYMVYDKDSFENAKKITRSNVISDIVQFLNKDKDSARGIFLGDNVVGKDNVLIFNTKIKDTPPQKGYIVASISGTEIMSKRRAEAYRSIRQSTNPMPSLRPLITSGKAVELSVKEHHPINDKLLKKVFGSKDIHFTERQREAIDVAINTPDVAIIQGPPGTGKTTVIKAIVERLNEIYSDKLQILVSSTQHDAIENVIEKMECGGMPAVRIGAKFGKEEETSDYLYNWIERIQESCSKFLENEPETKNRVYIRYIYNSLEELNIENDASKVRLILFDILRYLDKIGVDSVIYEDILSDIAVMEELYNSETSDEYQDSEVIDVLDIIKSIKFEKDEFILKGARQLRRLITRLNLLNDFEYDIPEYWKDLTRISSNNIDDTFDDLLCKLGDDFTYIVNILGNENHVMEDQFIIGKSNIIDKINAALDDVCKHEKNTIYDVIWDFKEKINNKNNINLLLQRYTRVKAATCQQSVAKGHWMSTGIDMLPVYDYVIIDEAARSNPLDLLIPMSLGVHVILVGDQNQLPHMLEDEVVSKVIALDEDIIKIGKEEREKILKESLFQRMYRCILRETKQRKRVVMLKEQYRMHPLIGDFVSKMFYNSALKSEAKPDLIDLDLYENSPIVWLNVEYKYGGEERVNHGYKREVEADIIYREINKILQKNNNFTIGIITFYKHQSEEIAKKISSMPLNYQKNIQFGTVDAFQGKEFDIVFLSTVRSNKHSDIKKRIGFLSSPNRLCVAFSRAKKMLIAVGDIETVGNDGENTYIEAFYEFSKLCKEEGYYESCH